MTNTFILFHTRKNTYQPSLSIMHNLVKSKPLHNIVSVTESWREYSTMISRFFLTRTNLLILCHNLGIASWFFYQQCKEHQVAKLFSCCCYTVLYEYFQRLFTSVTTTCYSTSILQKWLTTMFIWTYCGGKLRHQHGWNEGKEATSYPIWTFISTTKAHADRACTYKRRDRTEQHSFQGHAKWILRWSGAVYHVLEVSSVYLASSVTAWPSFIEACNEKKNTPDLMLLSSAI
jgi:hypothetical protein